MTPNPILFGATEVLPDVVTHGSKYLSAGAIEALIILGILLVLGACFFLWAALVRKPRKRKHSYHHKHAHKDPGEEDGEGDRHHHHRSGLFRKRRRHRRHHRDRPRNPTLAETGGLPPVRTNPPEPPPPA